jgi:hypothetical protein
VVEGGEVQIPPALRYVGMRSDGCGACEQPGTADTSTSMEAGATVRRVTQEVHRVPLRCGLIPFGG